MAEAINDTTELDFDGREIKDILTEESTLRNLGSRISADIRKQMLEQPILSIPQSYYRDDNYMSAGGLGTIQELDDETKAAIEKINASKDTSSAAMEFISRNGKAALDIVTNNPSFHFLKKQLQRFGIMHGGVCEHISLKVGESPVLNPPWQFNELDDARSDPTYPHMGRVYFNYIYANFPILVFQPGRAKSHANFLSFFGKGLFGDHKVINDYIRTGGEMGILGSIKYALTTVKNVALAGIGTALSAVTGAAFFDASKYITFKPAMKLYRDVANNLLREFAANLGLLDLSPERNLVNNNANDSTKSESIFQYATEADSDSAKAYENAISEMKFEENEEEESKWANGVQMFGDAQDPVPDYNNPKPENNKSFSGMIEDNPWSELDSTLDKVRSYLDKFAGGVSKFASSYKGSFKKLDVIDMIPRSNFADGTESDIVSAYQNTSYLPFLCQNTISISETFSNSTSEHPLVGQINSMADENRNTKIFGGADKVLGLFNSGGGMEERLKSFVNDMAIKITADKVLDASEMGMIMTGGGKMAIPEVWSGSSFSRNYSVDFEFASPVGDIISIFENRLMQTILCIALAAPLQTGMNSYMSPFMVRVFSKGLFSVDFGIIESLSITHGEEKNDRTYDNFPKTTKVSITVKDLTPTMMLSLGGGAFWKYRRANTAMGEYIATMCNLSISDRLDIMRQWKLYWSTLTSSIKDAFSLDNIGYHFSQSIIMKPFMAWNEKNINVDKTNRPTKYGS